MHYLLPLLSLLLVKACSGHGEAPEEVYQIEVPHFLVAQAILVVATFLGAFILSNRSKTRDVRGWAGVFPPGNPGRLFMTKIQHVVLTDAEVAALDEIPPEGAKYVAWRHTLLLAALGVYIVSTSLLIIQLADDGAFTVSTTVEEGIPEGVVKRGFSKDQLLKMLPLCQNIVSLVFYSFALWRWHDFPYSRTMAVAGYMVSFFLPFLYFLVPWMEILKPQEGVQTLCHLVVRTLENHFSADFALSRKNGDVVTPVSVGAICNVPTSEIQETMSQIFLNPSSNVDTDVGEMAKALSGVVFHLLGMSLKYIIYVPFFIGALETLRSLLPGVFGLMFGMQGGLKICKLRFPAARVAAWMIVVLQASALPVVMCLMALLLIVVGTIPVVGSAVLFTVSTSPYAFRPCVLLQAQTTETSEHVMQRMDRLCLAMRVAGVALLILGVYMAPHIMAFKDEGVDVVKRAISPLSILRLAFQIIAGMMASKVVFCDVIMQIMTSIYLGACQDPAEHREATFAVLVDAGSIYPQYSGVFHGGAAGIQVGSHELQECVPRAYCVPMAKAKTYPLLLTNPDFHRPLSRSSSDSPPSCEPPVGSF